MSVKVELMPDPVRRGLASHGGITCEQGALVTVDRETLAGIWTPSTLELLARFYWRYIERRTFGLIRVRYTGESQTVALFGRLPLLRFRAPEFATGEERASVTWPIDRGLLVSGDGRGQGFLRIAALRSENRDEDFTTIRVSSTVSNFYPWIRGSGRFARLGTWLYSQTQLRVHIAVTRGFLSSLEEIPDEVLRRGVTPGSV